MPGNNCVNSRRYRDVSGVHINAILTVQLQMKPQRKKRTRESTEINMVAELRFVRDI